MSWPRKYLLNIYSIAITSGKCTVSGLTAAEAKSLTQTLYRLRRRSDSSNVSFITPEHHMVTAMSYDAFTSSITYVYDDPDMDLPTLTGSSNLPPAPSAEPTPEISEENLSGLISAKPEIIVPADLVASLKKSASERNG